MQNLDFSCLKSGGCCGGSSSVAMDCTALALALGTGTIDLLCSGNIVSSVTLPSVGGAISVLTSNVASGFSVASHDNGNGTVTDIVVPLDDLSINANVLTLTRIDGTTQDVDLSLYLDDTNLARLVSGVLDANTGIATFSRDDATTFTVDFSSLLDTDNYVVSGVLNGTSIDFTNTNTAFNFSVDLSTLELPVQTDATIDGDGTTASPLSLALSTDAGQVASLGTDGKLLVTSTAGNTSIVVPLVTNGNTIATHDDGTGNVQDIQETVTSINITLGTPNTRQHVLTYVDETGTATPIALPVIEPLREEFLPNVGDNSVTLTSAIFNVLDFYRNGVRLVENVDYSYTVGGATIFLTDLIDVTPGGQGQEHLHVVYWPQ